MLIPRPSDDPRDPLNWPMRRKILIVATLCLATFAGFSGGLSLQLVPAPQSKLYGVTTTQMAYQNSCAQGGMAGGGFLFFPLARKFGRSSAIFWSLFGLMASQIWAVCMTSSGDYSSYLGSRFLAGFFGTVTGILGPRILIDMFFLHQRGRAFTAFHFWFDFGTVAGPTVGAFVASGRSWTATVWYAFALATFAFIMCFFFLHETAWDRELGAINQTPPKGFVANRIATFFPGTKVAPAISWLGFLEVAGRPFIVAFTPVTIILGCFTLVSFGMYVAMNSITPVWLQKPEKVGGYGFTSHQNALFSFTHWIGVSLAWLYGQLVSDRLPLWICSRRGGTWKPEYRLHALWFPALLCNPIGLGVFGLALHSHLHWIVLAVAQVLVTFGSLSCTPITVNYACEIFTPAPAEVAIILNLYRLAYGLSIAFYINPWVDLMGFNWAYGMMAFLQATSFGFVGLLMWKGHEIREWKLGGLLRSEEGECVIDEKHSVGVEA
ncbi:MFS multidrug transporter-like protein [Mollisia scopiformis]|uniref:MFS multidrug transporter-like protein n=1 Tax=Mollisia scopiformis TaxID=149040 RepID=A0A194XVW9_MOLSC|nr:MFS multidrug transporter-like protein [Mollisia scopiformis]KUJ24281.1 MFS multidrug transporter-like protein [Mollisia scopiformis]